ncbi:hypothetical protein ACFE04_018943 [Oxalis oulophora]
MEMRRPGYTIVFLILLFALASGNVHGKKKRKQTIFGNQGPSISPQISQFMAEDKRFHCRYASRKILASESYCNAAQSNERAPGPVPSLKQKSYSFIFRKLSNSDGANEDSSTSDENEILRRRHEESKKEMFIAIAVTATSTFIIVALFFICCLSIDPRAGVRDNRPLLNVTTSDHSDSSSLSVSVGNSSIKDFRTNSTKSTGLVSNFSVRTEVNLESSIPDPPPSPEVNQPVVLVHPPLKPPPGRIIHQPAPKPPPPPPATPPPLSPPTAASPPKPPPPAPPTKSAPPPPPRGVRPPPAPPKPSPLGPHRRGQSGGSSASSDLDNESVSSRTKLKPFFWDKVMASPDQQMVWHEISAGSFQFNEEMIETLFGYTNDSKGKNIRKKESAEPSSQFIQIIDRRKAQNLSILLRALNVTTEEVVDALRNELPLELLGTLLKMAPTAEEELKLRLFTGDLSQLGPAERFLKVLVEIPFAFKRVEALVFMCSAQEEITGLKDWFATLQVACNKLRSSRLFLKLLEAVLKTGNRMNDGTYRGGAMAFKLDTLSKLSDVKGTDGKTTLLHFVVQEIIRSEGIRAVRTARASQSVTSIKTEDFVEESNHEALEDYRRLGLKLVSSLSSELEDIKKAAAIDADSITSTVAKLRQSLRKTTEFLDNEVKNLEEEGEFGSAVATFVNRTEEDINWLSEEEKRIMALVKSTADYFHGNTGKDEGLRLFAVVRDFLVILDKACKEVAVTCIPKPVANSRRNSPTGSPTSENRQQHGGDFQQRLFPAIKERRMDSSSSEDDSDSS